MNDINEKSIILKDRVKGLLTSMDHYSMFQMLKPGFIKSLGSDINIIKGIIGVYIDPRQPISMSNRSKLLERRISTHLKFNKLDASDIAVVTYSRIGYVDFEVMNAFDFDVTTDLIEVKNSLLEIKNYGPVTVLSVVNKDASTFNSNDRCTLFFNLSICQKIETSQVLIHKTPFGGFIVNLNPENEDGYSVMTTEGLLSSLFYRFKNGHFSTYEKQQFKDMLSQIAPEEKIISCLISHINNLDLEDEYINSAASNLISLLFSEKKANDCLTMIELYQDATIPILKLFGKLNDVSIDGGNKELDITF